MESLFCVTPLINDPSIFIQELEPPEESITTIILEDQETLSPRYQSIPKIQPSYTIYRMHFENGKEFTSMEKGWSFKEL